MLLDKIQTLNTKVYTLKKDKPSADVLNYLKSEVENLIKHYRKDLGLYFKEKKILHKLKFMTAFVHADLEKNCKYFKVDNGRIEIEFKQGIPIKKDVEPIESILKNLFEIEEKDECFYLMIGYFSQQEHFEEIQLYYALT